MIRQMRRALLSMLMFGLILSLAACGATSSDGGHADEARYDVASASSDAERALSVP